MDRSLSKRIQRTIKRRQHLNKWCVDHFAILKVGPWLTFAFREAIFGLAAIENEWLGARVSLKAVTGMRSSGKCHDCESGVLEGSLPWR